MGTPRRYDRKFTPRPPEGGELIKVKQMISKQKPFTFYLLPFTFLMAFSFWLLAFGSGCQLNPNMQTPGESYLQGEWQQDSIPGQNRLLSYS